MNHAEKAEIRVDASRVLADIDPKVYGHFIENFARSIYGGLLPKKGYNGIRKDVLEEIKGLSPPVIRWPGGLFADGYHWMDGIGEKDKRPTRPNRYWRRLGPWFGPKDPNAFGSDEFLRLCKAVGAEPYININLGSGTPEEAAEWVEYTNGGRDTKFGALRGKNGSPEPYKVKYWGIGNEIFGIWAIGHSSAQKYARRYIEFYNAMRKVDPEIKFVAVGADDLYPKWNKSLLEIAGEFIDYLSVHIFLPGNIPRGLLLRLKDKEKHYYSMVAAPKEFERKLSWVKKEIDDVMKGRRKIHIALDEWSPWWNFFQILRARYTLRDAIFAAGVLNVFHRYSHIVGMANYAQLINVLGLINTNENDVYHSPIYTVFKLYREHAGLKTVVSEVECELFENRRLGGIPAQLNVPFLDCSATISEGRLTLMVINRHHSKPIIATLKIKGFKPQSRASVYEVNAPHPGSQNDFDQKDTVRIHKREVSLEATDFSYEFPAHSVTALTMSEL